MIALDTNVLARFLLNDDTHQASAARKLIAAQCSKNDPAYISLIVLCELVWVLKLAYRFEKAAIVSLISAILNAEEFLVEDEDLVENALRAYEAGSPGFADFLIREKCLSQGAAYVATFDKQAGKENGFRLVE